MEYHEYANLFPMMNDVELNELVKDMMANGYDTTSPVITYQDKILDGRNRHKAAMLAGVSPTYDMYDGDDPLNFVIRHNLHRRHLTESQRAVVASRMANMGWGGDKPSKNDGNFEVANLQLGNSETLPKVSIAEAAEMMNISRRTVDSIKAIERQAPELIERIERGEMTAHEATKEIQKIERTEKRAEIAKAGASVPVSNRWNIYQSDLQNWQANKQYDFIITDPPYPREYLNLYDVLAERSLEWLKPGGLLVAMAGQSYLDDIYAMMSKHLEYYWTAAYFTPGQPTPLRQVNVNTNWKPLLMFCRKDVKYNGKIFGDVFKSDLNDKDFHKWGQSESGMYDIVSKLCLPGQSILDPFCGAGTTGIAAVKHGCFFDGIELLEENVNISKARLNDITTE